MIRALRDMVVLGIETTCGYLADVIEHPAFARGETFTDFIPRNMSQWSAAADNGTEIPVAVLAAAALELLYPASAGAGAGRGPGEPVVTPWQRCGAWQIGDSIPLAGTAADDGGRDGA